MPTQIAEKVLWQALVCARPIPSQEKWKTYLQVSGLIHLFIVSGSHFLVLQWLLRKLRTPRSFEFFILWFYNAVTGFSAPGTRACLGISMAFFFKVKEEQKLLAIALLCLALEPSWIRSHSFWLSWLASLILFVTPRMKIEILRNFIFYGVWLSLGFSISFWSVPLNLILGPFISWVLFPLAFLSYVPGFNWLFQLSITFLEKILDWFSDGSKAQAYPVLISQLAGLVLVTHLVLHLRRLQWKGKSIR